MCEIGPRSRPGFFLYFLGCAQLASLCRRRITACCSLHFCSHRSISAAGTLIVNSFTCLFFVTSSFVTAVFRHYGAALYATRSYSDRKAVYPSVCLSVRQNERKLCRHSYTIWKISSYLVFWHKEWLVGDVPFYLKFWAKLTPPPLQKTDISNRYSVVTPQPLHLAKNKFNYR